MREAMSDTRCKCGTDAMGGCHIHDRDAFRRLEADNARLRDEVAALEIANGQLCAQARDGKKEDVRLREALERIAAADYEPEGGTGIGDLHYIHLRSVAREALNNPGEKPVRQGHPLSPGGWPLTREGWLAGDGGENP